MWMLFVVVVWGIVGMTSLVIDWGYVNLTRVQMQSMVDAGAVEGIRLRDVAPADPVASDLNRRVAVSRLATWTYDDDFDIYDSDDSGEAQFANQRRRRPGQSSSTL